MACSPPASRSWRCCRSQCSPGRPGAGSHALGAPGSLGVAEPASARTRPRCGGHAHVGRTGESGTGVRMASSRGAADGGAGAQRPGGQRRRDRRAVAAAVFGASLAGLVGTPGRYGQNWDAELSTGFAAVSGLCFGSHVASTVTGVAGYTEELPPGHHRRPARARDRGRPGSRWRLPHDAGRPDADGAGRDRARRADAARHHAPGRRDRTGRRQPGEGKRTDLARRA